MNIKAINSILMLLLLTTSCFIFTSINTNGDSEDSEQLFLISKKENNEELIESKWIIDELGNFHFVTKITYDNNSFTLFHAVNDQVETLVIKEYGYDFFEVFTISGGIVLFYAYHNYYGILKFHMYKWTADSTEDIKILEFNTRLLYPKVYIFKGQDNYHLFLTQMYSVNPLSEDTDTTIYHYKVFLNGTCTPFNLKPSWTITNEFDHFVDLDYCNGTLYLFYIQVQDFFGVVLPERFYQTIVTSPNVTYESNFMEVDEVGFDSEFLVTNDGFMHLGLARDGKLYTLDYRINQSIDFEMCNVSDIGIANHNTFYAIKTDNQYSYILNSNPYVSTEELFNPESLQSSIIILTPNEVGFQSEVIYLQNLPTLPNYHSFYIQKVESENWVYTHASILPEEELPNQDNVYNDYLAFYFSSTKPIDYSLNLLYHNLKAPKGFYYFWINIGVYLISIIGILALIYIIFRKKINLAVRKSLEFLLKPSKKQSNLFLLFFLNTWIFVSSSITALFILFKANKKRHFMNLIGMTILAALVITSVNIYNSKQKIIVNEYFSHIDLVNEGSPSLRWTLDFDEVTFGDRRPIRTDLYNITIQEILTKIKSNHEALSGLISGLELSSYMHLASHESYDNTSIWNLPYLILSDNYSQIFDELIALGRLPEKKGEVMFNVDEANDLNLTVGDEITSYGAFKIGLNPELGETNSTLQIVGLFDSMTRTKREQECLANYIPHDAMALITPDLFEGMIAFSSFGLESLEGLYPYFLSITTHVQFYYDFNQFDSAHIKTLKEDVEILMENNNYLFNFASHATWIYENELIPIIDALEPKLQSSVFLFFVLATPVLYLALFLILETNNLYSKNLQEEIYIFQSKGMSTSSIISKYTALKVLEALFATLLGFLLSLAFTPIFLKIDTFISFNNPFVEVDISTVGSTFIFTTIILVLVSLPKLIQITRKKEFTQKSPQKLLSLVKKIRLLPLIFIAIGAAVLFSSSKLYITLYRSLEGTANVTILMIFVYIAGVGLMLGLLGVGLLLKDFHAILMIVISKIVWKIKKSVKSFSLIEVRADIQLFNNIFLSFFILVGIILPSIICPLSVQFNLEKDAYLRNGADMYIFNWEDQNQSLLPSISNLPEVESVTNVTAVEGNYKGYNLYFYLINNTQDFLSTAYSLPERLFDNWEDEITKIAEDNVMLTTTYFIKSMVEGQRRVFTFEDEVEGINETITILGEFDYLPVFYDFGPYTGVTGRVRAMFMTIKNFNKVEKSVYSKASFKDRLLIRLKEGEDYSRVKTILENNWQLDIRVALEDAAEAQISSYPFYSLIAAEFVISMLVCIVAIIFISISNPIKILQHRMHKHDRLKKMGISTKRIIRLSIWETFFSGVLPGLMIGTGAGFALMYLFVSTTKRYFYAGIDFQYVFSPLALVLSYVVAPFLFYAIFYIAMKRNFARYMPRNIE